MRPERWITNKAFARASKAMRLARKRGASAMEVAMIGISVGFDEQAWLEDMERRNERNERARIERQCLYLGRRG